MSAVPARVCTQPGCDGPPSGVCIENLPFDECPNVRFDDGDFNSQSKEGMEQQAGTHIEISGTVPVSGGASFDMGQCDQFLRRRGGLVVALVAGPNVGKTTLITAIYELLRRNKLPTIRFAGCETIRGMEERCHLSREVSGLDSPDTLRTPVRAPQFLHLAMIRDGVATDVLFCDRAGESYSNALSTPSLLTTYPELDRADFIVVLVDGEQLLSNQHPTVARCRRQIRSLIELTPIREKALHVLVTKADKFDGDDLNELNTRSRLLSDGLKQAFDLNRISLFVTGARARSGSNSFGEGIEQFLQDLQPAPTRSSYKLEIGTTDAGGPVLDRMMNRLGGHRA